MVEEYQQALSVANHGGTRDVQGLYPQLGLKNSPQVSNLKIYIFLSGIQFCDCFDLLAKLLTFSGL